MTNPYDNMDEWQCMDEAEYFRELAEDPEFSEWLAARDREARESQDEYMSNRDG